MRSDWSTSAGSTAEWSTSLDLHLQLDHAESGGRRIALESALREAIRSGRLVAGSRLPSTRALATDLDVARGTVTDAYDQLVAEGWLVAQQGSGTTVAARPEIGPGRSRRRPAPDAVAQPRHDLRPGSPDLSAFPRAAWAAAIRRVMRDAPDRALGYGDPRGAPELRAALAAYVGRARGVRTTADQIVVCSGWAQALSLLASVWAGTGVSTVGLEDPCIPGYREAIAAAGLAVHPMTVDDMGADPSSLLGSDAGAVVVTPAHQYPMGTTLAPGRRAAFIEWARREGALIVEDDYDGEFRYDRQPVGALQDLDPERIAYAGTASKSLAPGLRLAWLALPDRLVEPVAEAKRLADRHTSALDQLALADLIERGAFDRHLRRARVRYRRRRDALVARLARHVPDVRPQGIAAGLHLLLPLPAKGPREREVIAHLATHGVAVHGLSGYWHQRGRRKKGGRVRGAGAPATGRVRGAGAPATDGLVVGYGTPSEHAYDNAIRALVTTLAEAVRQPR